jgi:seryl-tRNA synthetase
VTLRTWHPDGPNAQVEKKADIMPHHEVLLRLDAMDLDRGAYSIVKTYAIGNDSIRILQVQKSRATEDTSSPMMELI